MPCRNHSTKSRPTARHGTFPLFNSTRVILGNIFLLFESKGNPIAISQILTLLTVLPSKVGSSLVGKQETKHSNLGSTEPFHFTPSGQVRSDKRARCVYSLPSEVVYKPCWSKHPFRPLSGRDADETNMRELGTISVGFAGPALRSAVLIVRMATLCGIIPLFERHNLATITEKITQQRA